MSDTIIPAQQSRAQLVEAAWAASQASSEPEPAPAPEVKAPAAPAVTKETLNEKPQSAAPSIREFLRAHKAPAEPSGLELEVKELRAALAQIAESGKPKPAPVSEQQLVLQELQALRTREAERLQQEQEQSFLQAQQERLNVLRQGALTNMKAHEKQFPGLFALKQEDNVINELFARLEQDQDASEEAVMSDFEAGLREIYQTLHPIFRTSEDPTTKSEKSPTITGALAGVDQEEDLTGLTRLQLIERAWAKANS
jgi:hypothetical protein